MALDPHLVTRIERSVTFYGAGTPTPSAEARDRLAAIGVVAPEAYLDFVSRWGGAYCGFPVQAWENASLLGAETCVELTTRVRADFADVTGEIDAALDGALVIADDGSGNPILIDRRGAVVLIDHDNGDLVEIAPDFETLLAENVDDVAATGALPGDGAGER